MITAPIFTVLHARFVDDAAPEGFFDQIAAHHVEIVDRVEAGDPEGASRVMAEHLAHMRPVYLAIDRRQRPPSPATRAGSRP